MPFLCGRIGGLGFVEVASSSVCNRLAFSRQPSAKYFSFEQKTFVRDHSSGTSLARVDRLDLRETVHHIWLLTAEINQEGAEMKTSTTRTLLIVATMTAIGFAVSPAARGQVEVNVTIGGFYDELSPYGRWVDCDYGQCWVPGQVAADWQPYSNGQWIYTEYGWTWVSADPWGGSPYHYGTWVSIPGYGWSWVPGTVWAPAWVTWSYSDSYVGWAPLPPTVAFGASGYAGSPVVVSQTQYVFVPTNSFVGKNVASARIPSQQSAQILRQTKPVTGFAVSGGVVRNTALPMETIERASGSKIQTRSVQSAGTTPRPVSAGTAHLAVVAPAREVKAAVAAKPQAHGGSHPPEPSRDAKGVSTPGDRKPANAASKAQNTSPMEARQPAAQPTPQRVNSDTAVRPNPGQHPPNTQQEDKASKGDERQQQAAHRAQKAPKPKPTPPGKEKPVEKEQKPD